MLMQDQNKRNEPENCQDCKKGKKHNTVCINAIGTTGSIVMLWDRVELKLVQKRGGILLISKSELQL